MVVVAVGIGVALGAEAHVPAADRVQAAIAENNVASGRGQAVRLEMSLQMGDRPDVAEAELISHPTGLARLELRGAGHVVERHLLQGSELTVSRNGVVLDTYRTFLPPFFILQAASALTLRAALETFDVDVDLVGLAECGELDCLVLGDPSRVVPRPEPPPIAGLEAYAEQTEAGSEDHGEGLVLIETDEPGAQGDPQGPPPVARLWVDIRSYDVRGMDFENGVRIRLGPAAIFDELRVPAWILIEEPDKIPARFDVLRASQVNAPASAFTREWLLAPIDPSATFGGGEPMAPGGE
jgi:hypothetical protein